MKMIHKKLFGGSHSFVEQKWELCPMMIINDNDDEIDERKSGFILKLGNCVR